MADLQNERDQRRQVLVIKKLQVLGDYIYDLSYRFDLLKPYESPLPTLDHLAKYGKSVKAAVCSGKTKVDREVLDNLPSLELIVTTSVGVDLVDLTECRRRGVKVANAGGTFAADCADMAVGMLIDVLRKVSAGDRFVRGGGWPKQGPFQFPLGFKLGGKHVGIVGLGSIGMEVAKRIEAFGCIISYNSRKPKPSVPYPFYADVHELAANSDALIICCALTADTHHLINREVLLALGGNGVIVNIARGAIIDEEEMVKCLVEGEIGGAGLDVFEKEPEVPEELFLLDNVVLSSHKSVSTPESIADLYELIVRNLHAYFSNKPLLNLITED